MIFDSPFFTEMLLPFLLVFVVFFAILQKSKILGEGKAQIDAFTALAIGLILIGVPGPRDIIVAIMPWLAVGVAVILSFLILYGFVEGEKIGKEGLPKGLKITFGVLAGIFIIGVIVAVTGIWEWISSMSFDEDLISTAFFVLVVVGAIIWVVVGSSSGKKKDKKDED